MLKKCIIVDDELNARNVVKNYINDIPSLGLIGEFRNAVDALDFITKNHVDLIFLDIEMPKLSGINFAKIVDEKCNIIFTTAHREFALEGFELSATDYLLKPFSFERFYKAVQKVIKIPSKKESPNKAGYFYVKVNKKMIRIEFDNLFYIEGLSNYVKIHTNTDNLVAYEKMSEILHKLSNYFARVHKSYIVNTQKIELYTREYVQIDNKHIPVSSTYRNGLNNYLKG